LFDRIIIIIIAITNNKLNQAIMSVTQCFPAPNKSLPVFCLKSNKMKILKTVILVLVASFFSVKGVAQEKKFTEIGFGVNYSLLGLGDNNGIMNEITLRRYFNNFGTELSMNYVHSSSPGTRSEFYGFYDNGESYTLLYPRLNVFIVPISFKKVSFDIGAGVLYGYSSRVSLGYFDEKYDYPFYVARYECEWNWGYNLKMNLNYDVTRKIKMTVNAGFDALGKMHSNAFIGAKISCKLL